MNYYHRTDICACCGRYKENHIGKSAAGWEFSFQGYSPEENIPAIMSFEDWKRELQADGKIFNEYGEESTFEEFVELVEKKKNGTFNDRPNKNHFDHCSEHAVSRGYNMDNDWKDPEGHSFTTAEFS